MTAASGVVHEEMHEREFSRQGGTVEGMQLWVNLPRAHKMSPPRYQSILSRSIPTVDLGSGASARVIAGELSGAVGPAKTRTPMNVLDLQLPAGSRIDLSLPDGHNGGLVLRKGAVTVNRSHSLKGEALLAVLSADGDRVSLEAQADSSLVALTGEPIQEPVAQYGPFVMNTQQELQQAFEDYQAGRMGHLP
jgi:redox-sensitive bicupin YhaK (pirin superfamily)